MIELRTNTLVENYEYVTIHDPAVDRDRDDFEEAWAHYLDGAADCPLRAGGKPTIFQLRHLRKADRALLQAMSRRYSGGESGLTDGSILWAFRLGVAGIDHDSSTPVNLTFETTQESRHLSEASLEMFQDDVIIDVALRIIGKLNVSPK